MIMWKLGGPLHLKELEDVASDYARKHDIEEWKCFVNPEQLKSIPDIEHGHVLLRLRLPS